MEAITCLDCKKQTDTVIDYQSGDTICTECGLILDSHFIIDSSVQNFSHMTPAIRTKLKVDKNNILKNPNPNPIAKAISPSSRFSSPSCSNRKALLEGHHTSLEGAREIFDCLAICLRKMSDYESSVSQNSDDLPWFFEADI